MPVLDLEKCSYSKLVCDSLDNVCFLDKSLNTTARNRLMGLVRISANRFDRDRWSIHPFLAVKNKMHA